MLKIDIKTASRQYPVYLGQGLLRNIGKIMARHFPPCSLMVVTDRNVSSFYAQRCLQGLKMAGYRPYLSVVKGGEGSKTLEEASFLYSRAIAAGLDRQSVIIALGGGIIGDLAGFVAATYLRGVPYVQVPTTLLAMIDSSVGGKVAVNHPQGKNLIGAFYQPSFVLADLKALKTLPQREINAGLAELIKYGVIWDYNLFRQLESLSAGSEGKLFIHAKKPLFLKYISRAIMIKGKIVRQDEKEADLRRILNFGHTFGHALEAATGYAHYLHGEAVGCGMAMAATLACRLSILDEVAKGRIINILKGLRIPPSPAGLKASSVLEALFLDKKRAGGDLIFILPDCIGRVIIYKAPPANIINDVIKDFLQGKII
ncbi:MAG: 3-dehydroquinate synthase [Dethiobacteria bacterium]|jgi:3-dehydroquinate synthase